MLVQQLYVSLWRKQDGFLWLSLGCQLFVSPFMPTFSLSLSRSRLLQEQTNPNHIGKIVPENWEHAHNHVVMALRVYYRGPEPDPTFPSPQPPKELHVPTEKPKDPEAASRPGSFFMVQNHQAGNGSSAAKATMGVVPPHVRPPTASLAQPMLVPRPVLDEAEERRRLLKEVRDHLDILKEFEGTISKEELEERKRELYLSLPSAPPAKKQK